MVDRESEVVAGFFDFETAERERQRGAWLTIGCGRCVVGMCGESAYGPQAYIGANTRQDVL